MNGHFRWSIRIVDGGRRQGGSGEAHHVAISMAFGLYVI